MIRTLKVIAVTALCSTVILSSCAKKVTKTPPVTETEPAEEVKTQTQEFKPSDDDVFQTVDMDAAMRDIFLPIYFNYDQYTLRPDMTDRLQPIARFLTDNPTTRFLLEGHADERGTDEYNMGLGENRARAVKDYLASYGIQSVRLEFTSYGRTRPAQPYCTDEKCHKLNRRVEWKLLSK